MIITETEVNCDFCGRWWREWRYRSETALISAYRKNGWKMGKRHKCPNCVQGKPKPDNTYARRGE